MHILALTPTHTHMTIFIHRCCLTSVSGLALVTRRVLVSHSALKLTAMRCLCMYVYEQVSVYLCVCKCAFVCVFVSAVS